MPSTKSFFAPFLLWYLRVSARIQLRKINPLVIGVGGSAGKTSLVAALHAAIATTRIVRSGGGVNSETGIPLGILGIKMRSYGPGEWVAALCKAKWKVLTDWKKYGIYIAELGIDGPDEPKNMSYMLRIVTPAVGVLTNISLEHSEYFEKALPPGTPPDAVMDRIAAEEEKLLEAVRASGTAVVNLDDARIAALAAQPSRIRAKAITVSTTGTDADFSVRTTSVTLDGFYMQIAYRNKTYDLRLAKPLSRAYVSTLLLAVATAHAAGVGITDALRGITETWQLPPGRLTTFVGIRDTTVIDSSYNATPLAMRDALAFLGEVGEKAGRRRVAILGDMRELGKAGDQAHADLAPIIQNAADAVVLVGPQMQQHVAPLLTKLGRPFEAFATFADARETILQTVKAHDIVMVKGSQNTIFLERAVELLLANPADAAKLCRRGAMWDAKRSATA